MVLRFGLFVYILSRAAQFEKRSSVVCSAARSSYIPSSPGLTPKVP